MYEHDFANTLLTHRAQVDSPSAAERTEVECKTRELPLTRGGLLVMIARRLLDTITEWINGEIRLSEDGSPVLKQKDILQLLAVLPCSHIKALAMETSIDLL